MSLTIQTFPAGPIETNAYLVIDDATKRALIIDAPMGATDDVVRAAEEAGATIDLIYITHAHWDHVGDAAEMKNRTGAPLLAHPLSAPGLTSPGSSALDLPFEIAPAAIDRLVADGETVELGETSFAIMHLPGHEPGHTALYSEADRVFLGGDVLFPNGHGRIDIPGASQADMAASLKRLAVLPGEVTVYPGHGLPTTIGAEPWLQSYR
jgi:glyoxylase-like metal-dependent hydrolase (beta-lactamase superfamily II)